MCYGAKTHTQNKTEFMFSLIYTRYAMFYGGEEWLVHFNGQLQINKNEYIKLYIDIVLGNYAHNSYSISRG